MAKLTEKEIKNLNKGFDITSVSRVDVADRIAETRGISMEEAEREALKINDTEMMYLAGKIADVLCDTSYWETIDYWIEILEKEKNEQKKSQRSNRNV